MAVDWTAKSFSWSRTVPKHMNEMLVKPKRFQTRLVEARVETKPRLCLNSKSEELQGWGHLIGMQSIYVNIH